MLTKTFEYLKQEHERADKDMDRAGNLEDVLFHTGEVDMLEHIINAMSTNLNNNVNVATEEGYGIAYLQGVVSAMNLFLDGFTEVQKRRVKTMTYKVEVTLNETSHVVQDYSKVIYVTAPIGFNMGQLKQWLISSSPHTIEEYINIQVDSKYSPDVEVYDFDLDLISYE